MRKSLKLKIYTFVVSVILILLVLMNIYPLTSSRDSVFEEKRNSLTSQGTTAASALSRLEKLNSGGVREVIQLLDMGTLDRVIVADREGIIYDSKPSSKDDYGTDDIKTAVNGKTVFRSNFTGTIFESSYTVPVYSQGGITGAVFIRETDAERAEILMRIQSRIRFISLAVCAAMFIVSSLFINIVLKRLMDISDSMKVVADGDYSHRLKIRGKDEIADLGNDFNMLTERLETIEQQRRRFVSDASHELKTPLASIRLLSDSIVQSEGMDNETMRDFVTDIGNEASRLQNMTEKLLNLSRMDDDVKIAPEPVDVKRTAIDALVVLRPLAKEKEIRIVSDLEDGCVVMASTDSMFRIIFNLIENAIKYNVYDGQVHVTLRKDEKNVSLEVADTGIGIPEEERLNVFSRFYRVDKARSREAGGSGLGLSIVHDAVKAYGGSITIGANKPHGCVFTVTFPRATSEQTGI